MRPALSVFQGTCLPLCFLEHKQQSMRAASAVPPSQPRRPERDPWISEREIALWPHGRTAKPKARATPGATRVDPPSVPRRPGQLITKREAIGVIPQMAGADTAAENSLVVIESSPDEEQEATPSQPTQTRSFSINTADAKSSAAILSIIANERNWKECSTGTMGSIVWVVSPEALEQAMIRRKGDQRISHIPGMHCLCRKIPFARLMASFPFVPETFVLYPNENPSRRLLAALKAGPLILKPNDGTQGDGIHIVRTTSDLKRRQEYQKEPVVLQRYIAAPLLLEPSKLKFDLRIYALVLSVSPPRFFLCQDGLVRVCSEAYDASQHRINAHLTNYSLNKYEAGFEHNSDPTDGTKGTKRSLAPVLELLEAQLGGDTRSVWHSITHLVAATLGAMAAQLDGAEPPVTDLGGEDLWAPSREGASLWDKVSTRWDDASWGEWRSKAFHLLGVDVMLDEGGRAHLLEVNCNPSLGVDTVYVTDGPRAESPPPPHPATKALVEAAMPLMKYRGIKICKCKSHHRPHLHQPCPIDLTVKHSCVGGALTIVQRDISACKRNETLPLHELAAGTRYIPLDCCGAHEQSPISDVAEAHAAANKLEDVVGVGKAASIQNEMHLLPSAHDPEAAGTVSTLALAHTLAAQGQVDAISLDHEAE